MTVKSITIGVGRTYNIGNFESFRIDGAVEIELDGDLQPREAWALGFGILRQQMRATFKEFKPVKARHVEEKFKELQAAKGTDVARALITKLGYQKLAQILADEEGWQTAYEEAREALRGVE